MNWVSKYVCTQTYTHTHKLRRVHPCGGLFTLSVRSHRFSHRLKWVECSPVAVFTHSDRMIKIAADKNATSTLSVNRPLEVIV